MTSQPIRLSTNFMTLIPSLTFTDYEWFPWSICNGCGMPAGNAYPSGHLVPSPILGLANAPIVETKFLEFAMSLLDSSPRIPLGTFSILLQTEITCHPKFWIHVTEVARGFGPFPVRPFSISALIYFFSLYCNISSRIVLLFDFRSTWSSCMTIEALWTVLTGELH